MNDEYEGEFYFPKLKQIPTQFLKDHEISLRDKANKLKKRSDILRLEADMYLYESNYRNHINILKPLNERDVVLRDIINDPHTNKTARAKAERESRQIYEAFWGLMKFGESVTVKR